MSKKVYYHFDRRGLIKKNIQQNNIFKNNKDKLNGFFMGLAPFLGAKNDFGNDLLSKVNDYAFDTSVSLNFTTELLTLIRQKENQKVKKVLYEFIFEKVRREHYKNKPSRLKSLFFVKTKADLDFWKNKDLGTDGVSYKFIIESEKIDLIHEADANWFEQSDYNELEKIDIFANNYWSGIKSANPKNEVLINGEFTCEQID